VSDAESLFDVFNNGEVSTHFLVTQGGRIEQYLDSDMSAWATNSSVGNFEYCSVETQGCSSPPHADPMSNAMVDALARLYREGNARHGWAFQLANSAGANGFAYHKLFSATACPCDVRVNRRADILVLAQGGGSLAPPSSPSSPAPGGPTPPYPGTLLVNFTAGHGTAQWQGQMSARGWSLAVDDLYGDESERVCRQFQSEKGLDVDGIVGPATWDAAWTAPVT
jgi:peptidoglycan hydrolase-like protein with peptidoglycan-binding domain